MIRPMLFPLLAGALTVLAAQPPPPPHPSPNPQPHPEGTPGRKTAQDQGAADADVALSRQIRKEIQNTKGLGTHARNVKVTAKAGKVTLKGSLPTQEEKDQVEAIARKLAGDANVTSELHVKASKHGHETHKDHPTP